jgi:hypothetical protein
LRVTNILKEHVQGKSGSSKLKMEATGSLGGILLFLQNVSNHPQDVTTQNTISIVKISNLV